jgi:hypothetical protein
VFLPAESPILVPVDQLANSLPIGPDQRLNSEGLLDDRGVEGDLSDHDGSIRCAASAITSAVHQRAIIGLEQVAAGGKIGVISIGGSDQHPDTNAIESLNARFRRVRHRGHFPNEQAALKSECHREFTGALRQRVTARFLRSSLTPQNFCRVPVVRPVVPSVGPAGALLS